jgi:hypothetical protein
MRQRPYDLRPDCKEILEKKDSWALTEQNFNDFEINNFDQILERTNQQNLLVYSILQSKLEGIKRIKSGKSELKKASDSLDLHPYSSILLGFINLYEKYRAGSSWFF